MTPPNPDRYVRWLDEIGLTELPEAGGKNASLGELTRALVPRGVRVPEGFALTTQAYRDFLAQSRLEQKIDETLAGEFHRRTGLAGRSCPFPGMFRGALDARAVTINEEMKRAAAEAIASVVSADELSPEYIIASCFNRQVVERVAAAVARAAQATSVARRVPKSTARL